MVDSPSVDDENEDGEVLSEALDSFAESQDGSYYDRERWYDDMNFARMSDQWPEDVRQQRKDEARPCLTVNKLAPLIRQVVNESRQNKPGIKVAPVDNGADKDTAEVISGLIRSIERNSAADVAYDTAIDHAVSGGFGFFRIGVDYATPYSFDLEARIERIPNALMVHWDTLSTAADASDWRYGFVSEMIPREEFKRRWPDQEPMDWEGESTDQLSYWMQEDTVRIAEYFKREEVKKKLVMLSDGTVLREDEMGSWAKRILAQGGISGPKDEEAIRLVMQGMGLTIKRERESTFYEVWRRMVSGAAVLSKEKWVGSMIPICPVWGDEVYFDGRRNFKSMIHDAKDAQLMHNFWRSATTELVAMAPRAPFIMPENALPKDLTERQKWVTANTRSHAFLLYSANVPAPPQRQPFAAAPTGALQEAITANEDIQAITGIYPASIGARSNETSGRAILARERQANVSNFHFPDNLSRAIRYCGECLVEIIPSLYSERESIRILGDDMTEKVVKLTTENPGFNPQTGEKELYNLSVGKYDVSVSSGPSYATQREETKEFLLETMRTVPGAGAVMGDLVAEYMDFPNADRLAKRLQHMLPPQVAQAEGLAPPQQPQPPNQKEEAEVTKLMAGAKLDNARADQIRANTIPGQFNGSPGGIPPNGVM